MSTLFICELYESVQGEGLLTGTPSIFIRTSGCNLRCQFCDTPFSSWNPEGESVPGEEIVRKCLAMESRHVVLTGGEPMLQPAIEPLTRELSANGFHLTIETAGTVDRDVRCDLMSISPKMSNSTPAPERAGPWSQRHNQQRDRPQVISALIDRYACQVKFVVDSPSDVDEIVAYLERFPQIDRQRVLLMPQGTDAGELAEKEAWIRPLCEQRGFRYCPRMHIVWYGNRRGT